MKRRAGLPDWFNRRALRERVAVALAVVVVLVAIMYLLIIDPQIKRQRQLDRQLTDVQYRVTDLSGQEALILERSKIDPDQNSINRIAQLQAQSDKLQKQLEVNLSNLVSPQQMVDLLKELLKEQKALTLLSLNNQSPILVQLGEIDGTDKDRTKLYKHSLDIELSGTYRALLNYLHKLQQLPRSLVWEIVEIETEEYPAAIIRLKIYTLSLAEGWIGG